MWSTSGNEVVPASPAVHGCDVAQNVTLDDCSWKAFAGHELEVSGDMLNRPGSLAGPEPIVPGFPCCSTVNVPPSTGVPEMMFVTLFAWAVIAVLILENVFV